MSLSWKPDDGFPHFTPMATIDTDCPKCRQWIRFSHKTVEDAESRYWRERHDKLMSSINDVVERCNKLHGYNPVERWFQEELMRIRDGLQ